MSKQHSQLNRPVHLAIRDIHFERAVQVLCIPLTGASIEVRLKRLAGILELLETAKKHTEFARRSATDPSREDEFLYFMKLIRQNVQSVYAMVQNQAHLQENESFLCQFLDTNPEQSTMPAMAYKRRAEDILQGLWHVLRLAHAPYRKLQKLSQEELDPSEMERYKKAYNSFQNEMDRNPVAGNTGTPDLI